MANFAKWKIRHECVPSPAQEEVVKKSEKSRVGLLAAGSVTPTAARKRSKKSS
ncbi:MAG: hypothetical protein U0271_36750 [Polyangiaceae bacterium]